MAGIVVITGLGRTLLLFRGRLLEEMVRAGHKVVACAPENDRQIESRLGAIGVAYRTIPLDRAGLNPVRDLGFFFRLLTLLRRERPEILFAYTIKSVVYGSLAARLVPGTRVYSMISGVGYAFTEQPQRRAWVQTAARRLYRLALARNQAVFFQNPDDEDLFLRLGILRDRSRAVRVNGSGVDLEYFRETPVPSGPPVFLLIARMLGDKGILEFVEAARIIRQRHPHTVFRLVGPTDPNPTSLRREQIQSWSRQGVVEYREWEDDVRPVIAGCSVFVLPSYREGTPHTVLEAMATGRAIVTTDAPGCRETVRPGWNGLLVPVRNVPALVEAMERFVHEPALALEMGRNSRRLAEEKFDVHAVNAVILKTMGLTQRSAVTAR